MKKAVLRPEEEQIRRTLALHLGVEVVQHDNGSAPSMYDLRINYPNGEFAPVEVTSSVNRKAAGAGAELSKHHDGGPWPAPSLRRSWAIQTGAAPNVRVLRQYAESSLAALEQHGYTEYDNGVWPGRWPEGAALTAAQQLARCGVERAVSSLPGPDGAGILVVRTANSGSWDMTADVVVPWIEGFTNDPKCRDNLGKLTVPGAREGHLAVIGYIAGLPWPVWRALQDDRGWDLTPQHAPVLPHPVTHVWLFTPGAPRGLAYTPDAGWFRFPVAPPE